MNNSKISDVGFHVSNIKNIDLLNKTEFSDCSFHAVTMIKNQFDNCVIEDTQFQEISFKETNFENCNFQDIKFDNVKLLGCKLKNIHLNDVILSNTFAENQEFNSNEEFFKIFK